MIPSFWNSPHAGSSPMMPTETAHLFSEYSYSIFVVLHVKKHEWVCWKSALSEWTHAVSGSGSAMRGSCSSGRVEAVISCRRYRGHWPTQSWTRYSSSWALGESLSCCDESLFLNLTQASSHFISFTFTAGFRHICSPFSLNS